MFENAIMSVCLFILDGRYTTYGRYGLVLKIFLLEIFHICFEWNIYLKI